MDVTDSSSDVIETETNSSEQGTTSLTHQQGTSSLKDTSTPSESVNRERGPVENEMDNEFTEGHEPDAWTAVPNRAMKRKFRLQVRRALAKRARRKAPHPLYGDQVMKVKTDGWES